MLDDAGRLKEFLKHEEIIREKTTYRGTVNFYRHHLCHLASAYYPSGFEEALLVSYDGMGEIETAMVGVGSSGSIEVIDDSNHYPHSLGLFYSAITFFLGWKHHCDEGIIMGLAPFGNPNAKIESTGKSYIDVFREIIFPVDNLKFEIDLSWIEYHNKRDTWVSEKFTNVFGKKRNYEEPITDHHKNIAAALQQRLEEIVIPQLRFLKSTTGKSKLCVSGGVGLNCSLNGKILASKIFDEVFIQPASGDAGVSLGAALLASRKNFKEQTTICKNHNSYLGSRFTDDEIEKVLKKFGVPYEKPENFIDLVASKLEAGKIIGWFQGAAEFGPRALGSRSILSRPFPEAQRDHINARVKFREEFRPFAPAVLKEDAENYFHISQDSPHMLIACKVNEKRKEDIQATVHIDDTCRVQTVTEELNPKFYQLLNSFKSKTGCPVLLNTSFNVKGQPIVNNPTQAIETFLNTKIDILAIGPFILLEKPDIDG